MKPDITDKPRHFYDPITGAVSDCNDTPGTSGFIPLSPTDQPVFDWEGEYLGVMREVDEIRLRLIPKKDLIEEVE
jgi:S-adenosylmethionine synthetase